MLKIILRLYRYLWLLIIGLVWIGSWIRLIVRWFTGKSTPTEDLGLNDDPWVIR